MLHKQIQVRWSGTCIVAAPGPSLLPFSTNVPVIAVQDAYRMIPNADVLYACDVQWWEYDSRRRRQAGVSFRGEQWSAHGETGEEDKTAAATRFRINLIRGKHGQGFSRDPSYLNYGGNSGFQAINLAILFGATRILLTGFDMRRVHGNAHFFGEHPAELVACSDYGLFLKAFEDASKLLVGVEIINCTPSSALTCFEKHRLEQFL